MKLTKRLLNFSNAILNRMARCEYVDSALMDYLNTSEILYVHSARDPKTGFLCMHISFVSRHKLCMLFRTQTEYEETLKKIIKN